MCPDESNNTGSYFTASVEDVVIVYAPMWVDTSEACPGKGFSCVCINVLYLK